MEVNKERPTGREFDLKGKKRRLLNAVRFLKMVLKWNWIR